MTRGVDPAFAVRRPWTPLALTLGLHLLLVLAWLTAGRGESAREAPQRDSTQRDASFVLVQAFDRPKRAPDAPPPPPARSRALAGTPVQRRSVTAPAATTAAATTAAAEPEPAPAEPASDPALATALPGDLLRSSRAMAGAVDRALRNGSSPITAEPERKWERFAQAFAAARTGKSYTMTLESWTDPEGTVFYRKTIAGRKHCYRGGSVGGLVTGFGSADGRGAFATPCPSGASWTRQ